VSVAVGLIDDPARLGPDYVVRLAQRFPERAAKPPMLVGTTIVVYPPAALASGTEQRVAVLLTLRADGSIAEAQLVHEDPLFGPTALDALKDARFTAAEIDGKPVPYWAIVEFVFMLGQPPAQAVGERGYARRGASYPRQPNVGR
jgi:TonB family protein